MFSRSDIQDDGDAGSSSTSATNIALLIVMCFATFIYFTFNDSNSKEETTNVNKIIPNAEETPIYYHNKTYVHPTFTMAQTTYKLLNEFTIFTESSIKPTINTDYVLSWRFQENSRLHIKAFKTQFGLISLSACKNSFNKVDADRLFTYFALIRADRNVCISNSCNSWSCQKDYDYFNKAYDSSYCILVVKSHKLTEVLQFAHDVMDNNSLPPTKLNVGMFCGNPLIARSANTDKEVFFVNWNTTGDDNSTPFFICKFSTLLNDVNECFNTEVVSSKLDLPIALIHDPTSDVLMTANYNPENKNLNLLTYNCSRLSFKAAFRSIPTPSGWLISLGKNSKGKIFFAGDSAPYEVLGVYDTIKSKEKYHNLYV